MIYHKNILFFSNCDLLKSISLLRIYIHLYKYVNSIDNTVLVSNCQFIILRGSATFGYFFFLLLNLEA